MTTGGDESAGIEAIWRAVTPLGRSVLVIGLTAWAAAVIGGWRELAIVAAICLIGFLLAIGFLLLGRSDLSVLLRLTTARVVAGDPASTTVAATNDASRRALPVRLETRIGRGVAHVNVPGLASGATHDELFVIPTKRRSIVPVGPVRSVQGDPLGLVRREIVHTGSEILHVHPRTVTIRSLVSGWQRDLEGETTNDRSPSDVAFHTLREYVIGDDRRHIHWRTTARQTDGKLMVREFVDTRRAHVGLLLASDIADYATANELELAVSALASFGLRCLADEQDLTCLIGNRRLPTFHGAAFLDTLSGFETSPDAPTVVTIASRGRDLLASASIVVIIVGSRTDESLARAAAERLSTTAKGVVVRAEEGAEPVVKLTSGVSMVTIGALDQLPRLMGAIAA